jgi:WXXGXW repeat (2 copies)
MRKFPGSRWLLLAIVVLSLSGASFPQVAITVSFGPPALPVYAQPLCPSPGYMWVPGYWAYDPNFGDYYWVPGTWVLAPETGLLWTPPWWGWENGVYLFHAGYWGPTVGFYGGINYGFGYFGHGYEGGRWNHGQFFYNRAVNNVNVTNIRNVYDVRITNVSVNRVSYNGGPGGIAASPTPAEQAAERERHVPPVAAQTQQREAASKNQQLRASANQGRPPIAATPKPGEFNAGVVRASAAGAPYHPPATRGPAETNAKGAAPRANQPAASEEHAPNNVPRPPTPVHARNLPAPPAPTPRNTGNADADKAYQQRQEQLRAQQEKEHEQLYQKQEQDHQRMSQQQASAAQIQQMERQHQQQTMQMEQQHAQQLEQLSRQAPPTRNEPARSAPPARH